MKKSFAWAKKLKRLQTIEREGKVRFGGGEYGRGEAYIGITKPKMWRTRPARPEPCGRAQTRRRGSTR